MAGHLVRAHTCLPFAFDLPNLRFGMVVLSDGTTVFCDMILDIVTTYDLLHTVGVLTGLF